MIFFATLFGRYGYRKVTGLLNYEGWAVGKDRVYTIWRQEGLQVPQKMPKRGRLWFNDGSCIRLKPEYENHVWSYDFVHHITHEAIECFVARRIRSSDIVFILANLFLERGIPTHIRSDNGPEFIAKKLLKWFKTLDVSPLFIEPGSPWENGYVESFNGKMRYELLDGELFYSLKEAKIIIKKWQRQYNTIRPHMSLGHRPPRPETLQVDWEKLAV